MQYSLHRANDARVPVSVWMEKTSSFFLFVYNLLPCTIEVDNSTQRETKDPKKKLVRVILFYGLEERETDK